VNASPPQSARLGALPVAHGITVSTAHGHEASIQRVVRRWAPDVESMEGGAFLYACLTSNVACAQVRAVSNRVERRNRAAWQIGAAVAELTRVTLALVDEL
jgi:futalosine hydrolase